MYDIRARNSFQDRAAAGPRSFDDSYRRQSQGTAIALPEAELLRAIGRALEEQRAMAARSAPLVDRIETILGNRLPAANDIGRPLPPEPAGHEKPIAAAEEPALPPAPLAAIREEPAGSQPTAPRHRAGRFGLVMTVVAATILGAGLPALMPVSPALYRAETTLSVRTDAASRAAFTQAAAKGLLSARVMASTVAALKLDHDPEFAGSGANAIGVALDLLSATGAAADPTSRAEAALKHAVEIVPDVAAGTILVRVTTGDSGKSMRIAARLGEAVSAGGSPGRSAETDTALRKAYDEAKAELAAFTAKSGEGNVKVAIDLRRQIDGLDAELKQADENILAAKAQADRLKAAKLAGVLDGSLPSDLLSPALQDWRDKYAVARTTLAQLSAELGPRHPRLLQQQAETDGLKENMGKELARLAQLANAAAKTAVDARKGLNDRRNTLIAQSRDTGVDLPRLTELREKANAARVRLEEAASATGAADDAHLIVLKSPLASRVAGTNGSIGGALTGAAAGLAIGLALALLLFLRKSAAVSATEMAVSPSVMSPSVVSPAPAPAPPATFDEMDVLRSEISSLRHRLRGHVMEVRQPRR
ncbi:exopolysaccharide biosynthesis protein [Rhizobium phaseoli]|uniref:Putative succinoglycan biosynthesis transport protein n=1 Tax=Rhizobium etli (strain CIAT 652) TaxID=491916 RepID=B3PPQ3_RHIE6|nr:succinoglycan biosynthesis protein ExoP [Rhizobium phaseoli]ACE89760.1 putative succinoglycan biosynthesis transport protein [Rhizobium etli CIAT 652]ANL64433.1 exopolysaccharide biosynthesis protein [Rhizobium phaseoli]ANL77248.1 exopolysaccharide biosynthesis protein [Rhizobium phaseoli]PCD69597.1 succinoglycan biosynthesis protein exop [Rhizobium phaseoli]PDS71419.1 succinoglycan biosynthesis protein exop [Rhizobium phaseoli]